MAEGFDTKLYYNIRNGRFERRVEAGTPGAHTYTENGYTNHVIRPKWISGFLRGVGIRRHDTDSKTLEFLVIELEDDNGTYQLQDWLNGRPSFKFLNCMENIDLTKVVVFTTGTFNNKPWMKVTQDGEDVPPMYTREDPKDRPDWMQYTDEDGKVKYDVQDQINFFSERMKEVNEAIKMNVVADSIIVPHPDAVDISAQDLDDDVPF